MKKTFKTKISKDGTFVVPLDIRAIYGEARPAVKMTIRGRTWKTRVAVYGGKYFLALWKAVREEEGLKGGETLSVTIDADTAKRTVRTPPQLGAALKKNARARAGWAKMSFTHKREWATAIKDAKKPETKKRLVARAIAACVAKR